LKVTIQALGWQSADAICWSRTTWRRWRSGIKTLPHKKFPPLPAGMSWSGIERKKRLSG